MIYNAIEQYEKTAEMKSDVKVYAALK